MKNPEEIKERLQWLLKAVDEPENQNLTQQVKLYAQIDFIKWLEV